MRRIALALVAAALAAGCGGSAHKSDDQCGPAGTTPCAPGAKSLSKQITQNTWGQLPAGSMGSATEAANQLAELVNENETSLDPQATTTCTGNQATVAGTYQCQTETNGGTANSKWRINASGVIFTLHDGS